MFVFSLQAKSASPDFKKKKSPLPVKLSPRICIDSVKNSETSSVRSDTKSEKDVCLNTSDEDPIEPELSEVTLNIIAQLKLAKNAELRTQSSDTLAERRPRTSPLGIVNRGPPQPIGTRLEYPKTKCKTGKENQENPVAQSDDEDPIEPTLSEATLQIIESLKKSKAFCLESDPPLPQCDTWSPSGTPEEPVLLSAGYRPFGGDGETPEEPILTSAFCRDGKTFGAPKQDTKARFGVRKSLSSTNIDDAKKGASYWPYGSKKLFRCDDDFDDCSLSESFLGNSVSQSDGSLCRRAVDKSFSQAMQRYSHIKASPMPAWRTPQRL